MKSYNNLVNKTFLDFTDDPVIISKVLRSLSVDEFIDGVSMMGRFHTFDKFSELTGNQELKTEAERQFRFLFNE